MKKKRNLYPVFVVIVFFFFTLLHQTDKLLIGSLQIPVSKTFNLNDLQWGLINTGALIVGTIFYPIWGYLYDRYARAKLLALASFIWGATTWLSSIVRTYPAFLATPFLHRDRRLLLSWPVQPGRRLLWSQDPRQGLWLAATGPAARISDGHDPGA